MAVDCKLIEVLGKITFIMIWNQNQNHNYESDFKSKSKS